MTSGLPLGRSAPRSSRRCGLAVLPFTLGCLLLGPLGCLLLGPLGCLLLGPLGGADDVALAEELPAASAQLTLPALPTADTQRSAAARPNIVLLMCDDLGWGDVGFNGNERIKTPRLDEMASKSLKFHRFYSAAPVCSPTRGSALTGRHPYRYGIPFANRGHMKPEEITLAEALKAQGYATGHFGKWHLGTLTTKIKDANRGGPGGAAHFSPPQANGFDVCFSTESKTPTYDPLRAPQRFADGASLRQAWNSLEPGQPWKPYGTRYWNEKGEAVPDELQGDDSALIMDRALPFIRQASAQEKPFFAVIWFHAPHLPVVAGPRHRAPYAEFGVYRRNYYGCITAMDEQVGRLRQALRQWKIAENTMVWFCSDNGPEGNASAPGSAGPLRGRKRSLYEGGVRVPGLLEWPARIKQPRSTSIPCVTSDYFPTTMELLGFSMRGQPEPIDGVSLAPLIAGEMTRRPRPIGFQSGAQASLIDNRFKLVASNAGRKVELFDLDADPREATDVSAEFPQVLGEMQKQLASWRESCARSASGADYP